MVVDVEDHALDGIAVQTIRLDELQMALGRFVLRSNLYGLPFFRNDNIRRETAVHKMRRDFGFRHTVSTPCQQRRHRHAVYIRGDHRHHFAVPQTVVRRQAG